MSKIFSGAMVGVAAIASVLAATPAMAQNRHGHGGGHHWRTFGGRAGYNGYHGHWRTGQRFTNWNNSRYYVNDWRADGLPPPRRGYRYYRDDNGDVVMAAIGTGIIASILGAELAR